MLNAAITHLNRTLQAVGVKVWKMRKKAVPGAAMDFLAKNQFLYSSTILEMN